MVGTHGPRPRGRASHLSPHMNNSDKNNLSIKNSSKNIDIDKLESKIRKKKEIENNLRIKKITSSKKDTEKIEEALSNAQEELVETVSEAWGQVGLLNYVPKTKEIYERNKESQIKIRETARLCSQIIYLTKNKEIVINNPSKLRGRFTLTRNGLEYIEEPENPEEPTRYIDYSNIDLIVENSKEILTNFKDKGKKRDVKWLLNKLKEIKDIRESHIEIHRSSINIKLFNMNDVEPNKIFKPSKESPNNSIETEIEAFLNKVTIAGERLINNDIINYPIDIEILSEPKNLRKYTYLEIEKGVNKADKKIREEKRKLEDINKELTNRFPEKVTVSKL